MVVKEEYVNILTKEYSKLSMRYSICFVKKLESKIGMRLSNLTMSLSMVRKYYGQYGTLFLKLHSESMYKNDSNTESLSKFALDFRNKA